MPRRMLTVRVEEDTLDGLTAGAEARDDVPDRSTWVRRILEAQVAHDRQNGRIPRP